MKSGWVAVGIAAGLAATSAAAQDQAASPSTQTIPGVGNFSLPSTTPTPRPTPEAPTIPNAVPLPTLTPVPAVPRATPTARATPRAAPTPRAAEPRPIPAATPVTAQPTSTPAPIASAPPVPAATPSATPTPALAPAPAPAPTPIASPATVPQPAPSEPRSTLPWFGGALLLLIGAVMGAILWRRRRAPADTFEDAPAVVAQPPMPPSPAPAATPRFLEPDPAPVSLDRPWIDLSIAPRRAGLNMVTATADLMVRIANSGVAPARNVRVFVTLSSARAGQDEELGALFAAPGSRPVTAAFDLAPGATREVRALASLARDQVHALSAAGRPMFVPVVAVNILYDRGDGGTGQTAAAFAIGIERAGADKLGPFWLDQPNAMHETLGHRPHALSLRS